MGPAGQSPPKSAQVIKIPLLGMVARPTIYRLPAIKSDPFVLSGHVESISEYGEGRWPTNAGLSPRGSGGSVDYHSYYDPQWEGGELQE